MRVPWIHVKEHILNQSTKNKSLRQTRIHAHLLLFVEVFNTIFGHNIHEYQISVRGLQFLLCMLALHVYRPSAKLKHTPHGKDQIVFLRFTFFFWIIGCQLSSTAVCGTNGKGSQIRSKWDWTASKHTTPVCVSTSPAAGWTMLLIPLKLSQRWQYDVPPMSYDADFFAAVL
jgi:hypothetical protein